MRNITTHQAALLNMLQAEIDSDGKYFTQGGRDLDPLFFLEAVNDYLDCLEYELSRITLKEETISPEDKKFLAVWVAENTEKLAAYYNKLKEV